METRPQKSNISFEEFEKLDIRLCEIMTCIRVPNTLKLYKMEINTGDPELGIRQVVSSIADSVSEDQLINKFYPFILNLEPREIRGIRSEAMIILAQSHSRLIPVCTDDKDSMGAILI